MKGIRATVTGSIFPRNWPRSRVSGAAARDRHVAHRHRRIEARPEAARGDRPDAVAGLVGEERRALAHRRPPLRAKADAAAGRAAGDLVEDHRVAGKAAGAGAAGAAGGLDRPFERRLDRRRRAVDVVPVEAEPGLEPQRVAGAEPDGQHLGMAEQRLGDGGRVLGAERDLEAVLAGIARARDDRLDAAGLDRAHVHEPHRLDAGEMLGEHRRRLRPLQREERAVEHLDGAGRGQRRLEEGEVVGLAGGVDDEEQVVAAVRDHQVVEDAAGRRR